MRRFSSISALTVALAMVLASSVSVAQVPTTAAVTGVIRANGGGPASDGAYVLTFSLWDAAKGGKQLWKEGPVAVDLKNGVFSYVLGSKSALKASSFAKTTWLQLAVGTDTPMPRSSIRAVMWSLRSGVAQGLECKGCVNGGHLAGGSIQPSKVGFAYAAAADGIKGGPAKSAKLATNLQCTGCVSSSKEIAWDGDVDLKGKTLKAGKATVSGDVVAGGTMAAKQFVGDGSKLTGIKTPAGACAKKGEVVKGIKADGTLICVQAMDPAPLPADGLNEISNGLLTNQFTDKWATTKAVPVQDNSPVGTSVSINVGDVGVAQWLKVAVRVSNSDIANLTLELTDSKGAKHTLYAKSAKGKLLNATYSDKSKLPKGSLAGWVGNNPKGKWTLRAIDSKYLNNKIDGAIEKFEVSIGTLSSKKVGITGKLVGGVQLKNSDTPPVPCNKANAGYMYFAPKDKLLRVCNGEQYFPVALTVVGSEGSPGLSCKHILSLLPASKSGHYWIDPDGPGGLAKRHVYCDMDYKGGGWTLVLHTYYTGKVSPSAAHRQNFAGFENNGIGAAKDFKSTTTKMHYFMPLKWWRAMNSGAKELRFEGENNKNAGTLENYKMNSKYGLDGSNETWIRNNFCNGSTNCFVLAPGFSTYDRDNDSYSSHCAKSYGNSGWWYAHCFHYNPHYQAGNKGHFTSHVKGDNKSNYWTWWVR